MQKIFLTTLSLFIVACQEQGPQSNTLERSQVEQKLEFNDVTEFPNDVKHSLERSTEPFQRYLEEKLVELDSIEEMTVESLQPKEVPVESDCIYGGELDGTIDITLDTDLVWQVDLFDENDFQVKEIDSLVQPMLNGKDVSKQHVLKESTLELVYSEEYVDLQIDATIFGQGILKGEWYICKP